MTGAGRRNGNGTAAPHSTSEESRRLPHSRNGRRHFNRPRCTGSYAFFKRYYAVFLFVLLEAGAISYYANSTSYTRATLLAGAARVTGGIEGFFASAGDYFSLRRENAVLLERLAEAETRLHAAIPAGDTLAARTDGMKYLFGTAKVVSNSIARQDNFFRDR